MNIKDLDGKNHHWQLTGHMAKGQVYNKSSYHLKARSLINDIFPTLQLLEEIPIPVRKSEVLYLDFYLPLTKLCIEVHGEQHYNFTPFYHPNRLAFMKAQKRDKDKKLWCETNNIKYIELPYNKELMWESLIVNN